MWLVILYVTQSQVLFGGHWLVKEEILTSSVVTIVQRRKTFQFPVTSFKFQDTLFFMIQRCIVWGFFLQRNLHLLKSKSPLLI